MKLNSNLYRDRAMLALHRLVGDDATTVERISDLAAAVRLVDLGLILAAGDHERPLDSTRLKPLATKHGCDVLATYVDPFLSGHAFVLMLRFGGTAWPKPTPNAGSGWVRTIGSRSCPSRAQDQL